MTLNKFHLLLYKQDRQQVERRGKHNNTQLEIVLWVVALSLSFLANSWLVFLISRALTGSGRMSWCSQQIMPR